LVVVGVRLDIIIMIDLQVMVVPVVVVPVVLLILGVTVVIEVRVRQVRVTMVLDRGMCGTPLVVVVPVGWVMVETVKVVLMSNHTAVMV
tara:strand:+ start:562 stop:828 length:267 start_codon:yes stop_codon:yes gene_type:complete